MVPPEMGQEEVRRLSQGRILVIVGVVVLIGVALLVSLVLLAYWQSENVGRQVTKEMEEAGIGEIPGVDSPGFPWQMLIFPLLGNVVLGIVGVFLVYLGLKSRRNAGPVA